MKTIISILLIVITTLANAGEKADVNPKSAIVRTIYTCDQSGCKGELRAVNRAKSERYDHVCSVCKTNVSLAKAYPIVKARQ